MNTSKYILLGVLSMGFWVTGVAQEFDSIPTAKQDRKILKSKEIVVDTAAMDMEGAEQMETMEARDGIQDNPLLLVKGPSGNCKIR